MVRRAWASVCLALLLAACGDDGAGSLARQTDAALTDAGGDTGFDPRADAGCSIPCRGGCCGERQICDPTSGICLCAPRSCVELKRECGEVDDGCGTTLACGGCAEGLRCNGGGLCIECIPDPDDELCGQLGRACGSTTTLDSCGNSRVIDCGDCPGSRSCQPDGSCTP